MRPKWPPAPLPRGTPGGGWRGRCRPLPVRPGCARCAPPFDNAPAERSASRRNACAARPGGSGAPLAPAGPTSSGRARAACRDARPARRIRRAPPRSLRETGRRGTPPRFRTAPGPGRKPATPPPAPRRRGARWPELPARGCSTLSLSWERARRRVLRSRPLPRPSQAMRPKISQVGLRCSQVSVETPTTQTASMVNHKARCEGASIQANSATIASSRPNNSAPGTPVSTTTDRNVLCAVYWHAGHRGRAHPGFHRLRKSGDADASRPVLLAALSTRFSRSSSGRGRFPRSPPPGASPGAAAKLRGQPDGAQNQQQRQGGAGGPLCRRRRAPRQRGIEEGHARGHQRRARSGQQQRRHDERGRQADGPRRAPARSMRPGGGTSEWPAPA